MPHGAAPSRKAHPGGPSHLSEVPSEISPIPPIPLHNRAHMRQRMTFRFVPLNDEPRLTGWILAVGVFLVSVGSEGSPITPKGGTFTWPRPSRWPITTGLFSATGDAGLQAVLGPEEKG